METILGELVSGNHFHLLGIQAELGRTFTADDDVPPGAHPVVMISHGYWRRAFGGDPDVIGRDLRVNGRPYTVVGVAPEDYHGSIRGYQSDFYAPVMMYDELQPDTRVILEARHSHRFFVMGRLAPGATMAQAQVSVDRVAEQFRKDFDWGTESGISSHSSGGCHRPSSSWIGLFGPLLGFFPPWWGSSCSSPARTWPVFSWPGASIEGKRSPSGWPWVQNAERWSDKF